MHQTLLRLQPTLRRQYPGQKIAYIAVKSPVINAWTAPGQTSSYVCMPTSMIDFMSSDGELAFIMGHETGHAVDGACKGSKHNKAVQRVTQQSSATRMRITSGRGRIRPTGEIWL